jgi:hypothetical protein
MPNNRFERDATAASRPARGGPGRGVSFLVYFPPPIFFVFHARRGPRRRRVFRGPGGPPPAGDDGGPGRDLVAFPDRDGGGPRL